jgi:UDP-N-acetylglucosamine 2-epimerase (non-hydrolysing)
MTSPIILIIGTRPEGIKMMPLYFALKKAHLPVIICSTTQHSELLDEVFQLFNVTPEFRLDIMKPGQDLFHITQEGLNKTKAIFLKVNPTLVLVQGDTTSSMSAALSAFYLGIPVGHVEAGLRTDDIRIPFPEEMNRRFISMIAHYHFAPTAQNVANLLAEGICREKIFCTGNTVVDALRLIREQISNGTMPIDPVIMKKVDECRQLGKQIILLTTHRRESFNGGIESILTAVKEFAQTTPDVCIFYPFHLNPKVLEAIEKTKIIKTPNIFMSKPLAYKELVYILMHADLIATDSGGIQEEAISLGKPVLVLREKTERVEGLWEGLAVLVGCNAATILYHLRRFINAADQQERVPSTMYGDGYAAQKIAQILINKRSQLMQSPIPSENPVELQS